MSDKTDALQLDEAPVRLCCGQRHFGVVCPDGKVMCCLCFHRFAQHDLNVTEDGTPEDVCKPCAEWEKRSLDERARILRERGEGPEKTAREIIIDAHEMVREAYEEATWD